MNDLQKKYNIQTKEDAINSQGEFDIDYVAWLENLVEELDDEIEGLYAEKAGEDY